MSNHTARPPLRRRAVLQLMLSSGLGLGLAACGGSDDSQQDETMALLRSQAEAAVASGLVGLVLGQVRGPSDSVAVAGNRRLGNSAPVEAQDRFAIGSNTKAMTCAAVVALADRGGPALSLTLPQALTEWADDIHPTYAQVTLADLLHHRGGMPAFDGSGQDEDNFIAAVEADTGPLPDTMTGRRAYFGARSP